jgi:hypothetical protein
MTAITAMAAPAIFSASIDIPAANGIASAARTGAAGQATYPEWG